MIRFSILTCTYNAGSVLQRTLDSILNQTWAQIEHIIVDGASKDNTLALVDAYRQRNAEEETQHDIVVSSEPDRGLYDAMNKALQKATGDYVVFLNAGDVLPNDMTLENISNDVNERSDGRLPAVLYGNTNIVDNDGNLVSVWLNRLAKLMVIHQTQNYIRSLLNIIRLITRVYLMFTLLKL